jgi:hypothetical protein
MPTLSRLSTACSATIEFVSLAKSLALTLSALKLATVDLGTNCQRPHFLNLRPSYCRDPDLRHPCHNHDLHGPDFPSSYRPHQFAIDQTSYSMM